MAATSVVGGLRVRLANGTVLLAFGVIALSLAFTRSAPSAVQRNSSEEALSPTELHGKKVFLQRCSICHLPPLYEPPSVKPYGPLLDGYVRSAAAEAQARKVIREGTPRMPGFQYGLQPNEINDVIAYLKTMKASPAPSKNEGKNEGGSDANTGRSGD
jgi:mono/diheme cytochrome c family protein